jgi:S-layer protein
VKNNKYSIRRVSAGIASIIIGLSVGGANSVKAEMSKDNKVIIDENGVRPVVEPISPKNPSVESINKPTVKPAEKPNKKPENKPSIKPAEKPIEKPGSKLSEKTEVNPPVKQTEKIIEKPTSKPTVKPDRQPLVESKEDKTSGKHDGDKFQTITDKEKYDDSNKPTNKDLLIASLSGRDIRVEYKKGSISVDKLYVESIKNSELNKSIENKLGKDYKVIETFEIHFEKDDKKIDSNEERTVTITIAKKDNAELEVYHVANDNSLEKMNSKYSSGELQFSVNHFSKFTIVERIKIGNKDLEERAQVITPEIMENTKNKDDELPKTLTKQIDNSKENTLLPKTGIESMATEIIGIMLILVIVLLRKEQNNN